MSWIDPRYEAHQRARFMRPDAARWLKPPHPDELKYSPNQPRVPAGNGIESGRWTDGEGDGRGLGRVHLAANDKPRLGRGAGVLIAAEISKRLLDAYRSQNLLRDLFGGNPGTVGVTNLNGIDIYGSSSTLPSYSSEDDAAAYRLRDQLISKYPTS